MGSLVTDGEQAASHHGDGWARRRQRVAVHIERIALELIGEAGPTNVTVDQIAAAAGISPRTFFRYFASRDDVVDAMPRRQNEALFGRVAARPATEGVLQAFLGAIEESPDEPTTEELILWWKARQHWPEDVPAPWMVVDYAEVIADRLGAPADDLRVQILATVISHVMWLALLRWLKSDRHETLKSVIESCFTVISELQQFW